MRRLSLHRRSLIRFISEVLCTAAGLGIAAMAPAQTVEPVALTAAGSHRLIVVYRNGSIPGYAEQTAQLAGAHLLRRHERIGAAIVTGTAASEAQLRTDPSVEYVVQDRVVAGSAMLLRPLDSASSDRAAPRVHANLPRLVLPDETADSFYTGSPQGWAVRAVGGFGGNVAGSGTGGPWATSTAEAYALLFSIAVSIATTPISLQTSC